MKPYSVLLLYPDYAAEAFGQETYFTHVAAESTFDAVETAQLEMKESGDPADFIPLLVIEGHHNDIKPGE